MLVVSHQSPIIVVGSVEANQNICKKDDIGDYFERWADLHVKADLERNAQNLIKNEHHANKVPHELQVAIRGNNEEIKYLNLFFILLIFFPTFFILLVFRLDLDFDVRQKIIFPQELRSYFPGRILSNRFFFEPYSRLNELFFILSYD